MVSNRGRAAFKAAGVGKLVKLAAGEALAGLEKMDETAFCFLDAEKEIYGECYELVVPRLVKGRLLVADNAINHRETLQPVIDRALADERIDALVVPIGKGELVCRKV